MITAAAFLAFSALGMGASDLDGKWQTDCAGEVSGGQQLYTTHAITFQGDTFEFNIKENRNSNCSNLAVTVTAGGTFELAEVDDDYNSAINFKYTHSTMTPASNLIAQFMNSNATCGITDWQANSPHDVSGRTCNGQRVPANGETVYDIYEVDLDTLYFGSHADGHDGTDAAHRPTDIDSTIAYKS